MSGAPQAWDESFAMAVTLRTPLVLVTDDDFVRVSQENDGYRFEREADGSVTVSPNFTVGGAQSGNAFAQLLAYASRAGGRAFDSSSGFRIGPVSIRSPGASWVSGPRIAALTEHERAGFWPLSPDVAIEINSTSDAFARTIEKINLYAAAGTTYAVAIDPKTREVVEVGSPPPGLELDFTAIVDP